MLFDLKGKRRRAVQGTYLTLAVLMGAGLVLFGIGSSVNGGLGDLFKGGNGSNKGNEIVQKKIDAAEKVLQRDPRNVAALAQVIRGHYQLASATADPNTGQFGPDARRDLQQAAVAWKRYLATNPKKPDTGLASTMVQAYTALAQGVPKDQTAQQTYWAGAAGAVEVITEVKPTVQNYLGLVTYATRANQTSKADLAGKKAIALAPKGQRKAVKQEVDQAKAAALQQGTTQVQPQPTPTAP